MLSDRNIKRFIGAIIWDVSETMHWPLGKCAPKIFGWMIGSKGKQLTKPKEEDR
jgi:hypothetical protein